MSSLTVYGDPESSRAWWNTWMCRELNLDFDNVPLRFLDPEIKGDEYRAVNPNGFIPTIKDGEFKLFESMAINLYLAKKSGSMFYPESLEEEALAWQWSFWAVTRIEVPLLTLFVANLDHGPHRRAPAAPDQLPGLSGSRAHDPPARRRAASRLPR